jgi:hypothetical protein
MWQGDAIYELFEHYNHYDDRYEKKSSVMSRYNNRYNEKDLFYKMLLVQPHRLFQLHPELFGTSLLNQEDIGGLYQNNRTLFKVLGFEYKDLPSYVMLDDMLYDSVPIASLRKHSAAILEKVTTKEDISSIAYQRPALFFHLGFSLEKVNSGESIAKLLNYCDRSKKFNDRYDDVFRQAMKLNKTELREFIQKSPATLRKLDADLLDESTLTHKEWLLHILKPKSFNRFYKNHVTPELVEDLKEGVFVDAISGSSMVNVNKYLKHYEGTKNLWPA